LTRSVKLFLLTVCSLLRIKQIIAVAVAHVTQCPYWINGHTKAALRAAATPEELMEAI
jgi:AhpD family alkylhydroperoxidase